MCELIELTRLRLMNKVRHESESLWLSLRVSSQFVLRFRSLFSDWPSGRQTPSMNHKRCDIYLASHPAFYHQTATTIKAQQTNSLKKLGWKCQCMFDAFLCLLPKGTTAHSFDMVSPRIGC